MIASKLSKNYDLWSLDYPKKNGNVMDTCVIRMNITHCDWKPLGSYNSARQLIIKILHDLHPQLKSAGNAKNVRNEQFPPQYTPGNANRGALYQGARQQEVTYTHKNDC